MDIRDFFRIKTGDKQGQFLNLAELHASDYDLEHHLQVFSSMWDPKIRKKKDELAEMGTITERMKVADMAKMPEQFKQDHWTILFTHNWVPISLEKLWENETKGTQDPQTSPFDSDPPETTSQNPIHSSLPPQPADTPIEESKSTDPPIVLLCL